MIVRARKVPRWESELWSYISKGDGETCPLYSQCQVRQRSGYCPVDDKERIDKVIDCKRFRISDYNFIECWEFCEIFKLVEMLAQSWLKKGGVHCPPVPTKVVQLADEEHPVEIRQLSLKVYHGSIWHLRDKWVIQLKSDDEAGMKRLTLFHEAFHILAHCKSIPVFNKRGSREGVFNEMLADKFATSILMPEQWVKEKWAEVKDLNQMAKIFQVSKPVLCIRLRRQGLIQ